MAELPGWTPFDPEAPPSLPDLEDGAGRIVAVVATYLATTLGWAGRVAADLAGGWSARGHRVVLADAGLVEPQLHEVFGAANAEGLTDAALFGASVRRIARPVRGGSYFLVSAGTPVADPGAALRSPRWMRLRESFRRAGVTLVVFVSPDEPGRPWVLEVASDVVVLAGPNEDVRPLLDGAAASVRGVLGVEVEPVAAAAVETPEEHAVEPEAEASAGSHAARAAVSEPAEPEPSWRDVEPLAEPPALDAGAPAHREAGEELPAWTAAAREQQAVMGDDPRGAAAAAGPDVPVASAGRVAGERARPSRPSKPREGGRRIGMLLVLLLVLLALVVAAAFGLLEIPGLTPLSQGAPEPVDDLAVAAPSVPGRETTPALDYSVVLGAFQDPGVASTRGGQLVGGAGTFVAIAPVVVDGTVYHRLLAGPAGDSAEAASLLARIRTATGLGAGDVAVRATPLAFRLGETPDRDAAARRVQELEAREIPAYVLAVEYEGGGVRYRIYAGAYADEAEAEYLSARLAERGLGGALLSNRTGRVPE